VFLILNILKIVAVTLGLLLAVILLLIGFIMIAPLSYKVLALTGAKKSACVKARWLFGIVGVKAIYKNSETTVTTYVCGFALKNKPKNKKPKKHEKPEPDNKQSEHTTDDETTIETNARDKNPKRAIIKKSKRKKNAGEKKTGFTQFINEIIIYPDKKPLIDKIKLLIKRLYRTAKPKYFYLGGEVGFDSPHHTGYMLAALGMLRGMKNLNIDITPNMEEKAFDIILKINGRMTLFGLSLPVLLFIFAAPVRRIIKTHRQNKSADEKINQTLNENVHKSD